MDYKKLIFPLCLLILLCFNISLKAQIEDTTQRNPEFLTNADQLVQDLSARLTLSEDQAKEIREILVDYQENVINENKVDSGISDDTDMNANDANMNTETENQTDTETDMNTDTSAVTPDAETKTDIDMGNQTDTEIGITPDISSPGSDPQSIANSAIEEVLNDTQRTTWSIIRDAWWKDVNNRYGWGENKQDY